MLYVGIDLGTSAVKLLLMDGSGKIQKIVSREYPLYFPHPGWSEQKPEDWYAQTMDGMKELLSECDKSQVAGISFGGQMHGLVILDENGEIPAIFSGAVYIAAYPSCAKRKIRRLQECGMCCKTLRKYLDSTFLSGL